MEIFPYVGLNGFRFEDDLATIKRKLLGFTTVHASTKMEFDKRYPSLYIQDIDLLIIFLEKGERVRYFEIASDVQHMAINLFRTPLKQLSEAYKKVDKDLMKLDDGIDSPMFGIRVSKNQDKDGNLILVYSQEYATEPLVTEEDIIKFYLK